MQDLATYYFFTFGLFPSIGSFTVFQIGSDFEEIKQRIECASEVLTKFV